MTRAVAVLNAATEPSAIADALNGYDVFAVPTVAALTPQQRATVAAVVIRSGASLDADDIGTLPALRHVVRPGSGTDNIDVTCLAVRGIQLHRNPDASAVAVAEWVLVAAIALLRRIPLGHNGILAGAHLKSDCVGGGLAGRRVAIWGGGPVGRAAYSALSASATVEFATLAVA